ncbi:uncharacterized protein DUF4129 [Thermosporothrix hazakensis]|jgi:transglutaminase-like putative cysteine protease|uniref:Uncharacterized protein DUF4129 n=1 Tax=Thermosporothrix hazakensis TaxID=644383 RepID=A0A326TX11_THEHA|nr:transglutaminaseTgpA domain-containing protein [Thermosporothrix hazakensis]PZW21014.1 uncharacterized protein DUF4129 [Thermosporothrix hazakensis]GCE49297.1 transglutaminase [Thermosporothrix hazakensis]
MQDAAVDKLLKTITRQPKKNEKPYRRRQFELHFSLDEGWFSLILVAAVVFSTIWCIQVVNWVDHLQVLTLTAFFGLILGVFTAKQKQFPRFLSYLCSFLFGLLLAYWQTAASYYQGDFVAFAQNGLWTWWTQAVLRGGFGDDNSIYFFFILLLGYLLAYISAWLVYRTRSPWLMIVANATVLLINLNNAPTGVIIFLVVFLLAALLLLLRFNLYESMQRWNRLGLRHADDLSWDIMQFGSLISVVILIGSWILPASYADPLLSQIWNDSESPWVQFQNTVNRIISTNGGANASNRGNFRDTLALGGNPNLNDEVVFRFKSDDAGQYLASVSYDYYTGRSWMSTQTGSQNIKANTLQPVNAAGTKTIKQTIRVVNPPSQQYPYLFGASEIVKVDRGATVLISRRAPGEIVAWLGQNGYLTTGTTYTVESAISNVDKVTLRKVPLPADAPSSAQREEDAVNVYAPQIVETYTQLPKEFDPEIKKLALSITAGKQSMYDKVEAIESYLRQNYRYNLDVQPPSTGDPTSWFLFHSKKEGYCNYFASAMTLMLRSVGIPARVVAGYTNGDYDAGAGERVVKGKDAHAWSQVYFAGYGWINFEPSSGFGTFYRPETTSSGSVGLPLPGQQGNNDPSTQNHNMNDKLHQLEEDAGGGDYANDQQVNIGRSFSFIIGSLVLALLFGGIFFAIWWRRLFRNYSFATQVYRRICLLADWAGIKLAPSQTPLERMEEISRATPAYATTLQRLGDIYVREQWADPQSAEHPRRSGEVHELPGLWRRLQPQLFFYVLKHPSVVRSIPRALSGAMRSLRQRRRKNGEFEDDL